LERSECDWKESFTSPRVIYCRSINVSGPLFLFYVKSRLHAVTWYHNQKKGPSSCTCSQNQNERTGRRVAFQFRAQVLHINFESKCFRNELSVILNNSSSWCLLIELITNSNTTIHFVKLHCWQI
jgi:hypothetical protein